MKTQRLTFSKGLMIAIPLTLLGGVLSPAEGQEGPNSTASAAEEASSSSATGSSSVEQVKANGQSEQERLLLAQIDKQRGGLSKSDTRVSFRSGSDSRDLVTSGDLSRTRIGRAAAIEDESKALSEDVSPAPSEPQWQYGGFVDFGYLLDFNHPANHLFRSRGTAFRVDSVFLNIAAFYVRKKATEQ